jgi:hypothetical protein
MAKAGDMKRITLIAAVLLAVTGCAASSSAPVHTQGGCSYPFKGNTSIRACPYGTSGLYSVSYRYENQYYWHPPSGYFAVAEVFYKANAPGRAAGAWKGRTISVGDACVIDENWIPNVKTGPPDCMDSRTGEFRASTASEQQSVLKFWQTMTKYVPASAR